MPDASVPDLAYHERHKVAARERREIAARGGLRIDERPGGVIVHVARRPGEVFAVMAPSADELVIQREIDRALLQRIDAERDAERARVERLRRRAYGAEVERDRRRVRDRALDQHGARYGDRQLDGAEERLVRVDGRLYELEEAS